MKLQLMLTRVPLASSLSLKGAHRWGRTEEPVVITAQARAFAIKLGGEMSFLRRGTPKGMTPAAGGAGSSSEPPRETGSRGCTAQGEGAAAGPRPAALALQGSRFAMSISPSQPGFTNRSARFPPAACSLLFLVSLLSSRATRAATSRMWARCCCTCYVGAARGSRWVLCLHLGHPQLRKQVTLILCGERSKETSGCFRTLKAAGAVCGTGRTLGD